MKEILCFGDSNTYGYCPDGSGRFDADTRWTGLLQKKLGTNDCKTRYNASAGTIAKGLEQVITKALKSSSHPFRLLVISPILLAPGVSDPGFDPEFNKGSELVSQNLASEYKKIAARYHADFLDAASVANASETDRQHLDTLGHRLLAEAIYKKITG